MTRERAAFLERLGYYLLGIAIGLMILGAFWSARQRAARSAAPPPGMHAPAPETSADTSVEPE